jgi:hypothetical protein
VSTYPQGHIRHGRYAGVLAEIRAMRNPPAPSPTIATAETSPTNASYVAAPDTANKAAADPPTAFDETAENVKDM